MYHLSHSTFLRWIVYHSLFACSRFAITVTAVSIVSVASAVSFTFRRFRVTTGTSSNSYRSKSDTRNAHATHEVAPVML